MIDLIRLFVGIAILGYAAYTDIKIREASNKLWLVMGSIGIILLLIEKPNATLIAISMAVTIPFSFMLYLFGMGGADVKAMWAIALLAPLPPSTAYYSPPFFIFPLTVLINSLLLIVFLPVFFLFYNVRKGDLEFPYCLFGYKMRAMEAKNKFVWSMEQNGKKSIMPVKDFDFEAAGNKKIWVTPKLPFLVFIFAGYIISFIFGDILFFLLSLFQ
ncbi:MAG TPA: A24 family peptidase [Thermoplasmatales archaeon]|nr:A24 family peptidase [Thermoplasmatales archaeon]